ncbi:MAG: hypothetical protein IT290_00320 [Deltaproteobacteria bacterium]|nr:hypothetical protein [Deltaproteobacteria bacterium]
MRAFDKRQIARGTKLFGTGLMRSARVCAATILVFALSACSIIFGSEGTPEAKQAALLATNHYLTAALAANPAALQDSVAWSDYTSNKGASATLANAIAQAEELRAAFPLKDHPLTDLIPTEIWARGDTARIRLKKRSKPAAPEIEVTLIWAAGGWLVVSDNIFGDGEIAATTPRPAAKKTGVVGQS